jgi:hypothetical protein
MAEQRFPRKPRRSGSWAWQKYRTREEQKRLRQQEHHEAHSVGLERYLAPSRRIPKLMEEEDD